MTEKLANYMKSVPKKSQKKRKKSSIVVYDVSSFLSEIYRDNLNMAEQLDFYRAKYGEQKAIGGEFIEVGDDEVEGIK